MIKYKLSCKNCEFSFDSWFASSKEYEKLKKKNFLNCHNCGSKNVGKTLMAPKLINKFKTGSSDGHILKIKEINKKIKDYQNFIKKNFEYVGENFAYEARSIHYKNKKKDKGIYGSATKEEIMELKEEGIDIDSIPWIEDKSN